MAKYRVDFETVWSSTTHPAEFPATAHFSGLIGATHQRGVALFEVGEIASLGIKDMAERGTKVALLTEIVILQSQGQTEFTLSGAGVSPSPGQTSLEFDITLTHPLVTITTMIAPSPDWFLAVSGVDLTSNGTWVNELEVEAIAYDAGTDSGLTFSSSNQITNPFEPIFKIVTPPLAVDGEVATMGTFRFVRIK